MLWCEGVALSAGKTARLSGFGGRTVDGTIDNLAHFFEPKAGRARLPGAADSPALLRGLQFQFQLVSALFHSLFPATT
jgi:hypothetical protein